MNEFEELKEKIEIANYFEDFEAVGYYEEELIYLESLIHRGFFDF